MDRNGGRAAQQVGWRHLVVSPGGGASGRGRHRARVEIWLTAMAARYPSLTGSGQGGQRRLTTSWEPIPENWLWAMGLTGTGG